MNDPTFSKFTQMISEYRDTDQCASAIRRETNWWMGTFTAVFSHDLSHVLMVQLGDYARDANGRYPWTLPGGSVEPGERATVAAKRELFEETSLLLSEELITAAWFARPYYQSPRSKFKGEFIVLFAARCAPTPEFTGKPTAEIREHRFVPFDGCRPIIEALANKTDSWLPPHWMHWAGCASKRLAGELSEPLRHCYGDSSAMQLPLPTSGGAV